MCEVARRCSSAVLAVGGVLPLVALLSHAQEAVRCGACRALLQLCRCVEEERAVAALELMLLQIR